MQQSGPSHIHEGDRSLTERLSAARLSAALAPATQRCSRNGWRKWEAFALDHGATTLPADPEALAAFVEHLAAAVARIEATAYRPRPRGRGIESPATAKARADLEIALIRTMRDTLARVSEAAAFTWKQIERRPDGSATITFRRPKTDADTTAYLAPITVAALDAIRRGADDAAPVFGLSTGQIKRRIQAAAKAAGLEGVSSYGCRIGMAQDLARPKGIEMPAIMQAGGWRSETTVARYTARESAARGAVARFYEQESGQQ